MQCSNARLLSSDGSSLFNELNFNNSVSSPTRRVLNQLKACSCARSSASASNQVFPTLTLVRAILLQSGKAVNSCSFFQIQLSIWHFHPQTLSSFFRNFHWKSRARLRESQCGRIQVDYQPLPAFTS